MGKRPRSERRLRERALKQEVREREKLVGLAPGGAPDRPIPIETPALIEGTARSMPCHQCGGEVGVDEHAVDRRDAELLRRVDTTCRRCHARRTVWFRLAPRLVH
jgi:hypothetical protein